MLTGGQVLHNRYEVEQFLGGGGFGRVYRALDRSLQTTVAIKELYERDTSSLRRFEREARLLARLRHPALPAVIDHFIEDNIPYVVMDFIPGRDLEQYLETQPQQRLSEDEALEIIAPILGALHYLHNQEPSILHRDIKPSNIRITPDRKVFLVDFGLAKASDPYQTATATPAVTSGYSPPEQYYGDTDARSDLYAVGATLYRMLTGSTPPDALRRKAQDSLVSLRKANASVSFQTAAVVDRLLVLKPEQRYQNITSVTSDLLLKNLFPLQGLPPDARSNTSQQGREARPTLRFSPIIGVLVTIVVLVAGIFTLLFFALSSTGGAGANATAELAASALPSLQPATATVQAIDAAATALCATNANIALYDAHQYTLAHKTGGNFRSTGVSLSDFAIEAYFENPYDRTSSGWDYGFTFPQTINGTTSVYLAVVVDSDQKWNLVEYKSGETKILTSDRVDNLAVAEKGANHLRLYVQGNRGSLFVNGKHIAELNFTRDIAFKGVRDIWITTGILPGHTVSGKQTGYEQIKVCASSSAVDASFATATAATIQIGTATAATSTAATAAAQAVFQATATVAKQRLQMAEAWPIKFTDTFSPTMGDWYTGIYTDTDYGIRKQQFVNGIFRWDIDTKKAVNWSQPRIPDPGPNFYVATTMRSNGPTTISYGLILRYQQIERESNKYFFSISNDQTYAFWIREQGKWSTLVQNFSGIIKPNTFNRIAVVVEENDFYFYINGQYINEYRIGHSNSGTISPLSSGTIGMSVDLGADTKSVVEIDDIEVRAPS